jgi:cell division protein FtsN
VERTRKGTSDLAQDDYYYEIQLTNKQLVFYFMAGAAGLILSFLAGVMVGRGIDASAGASSGNETKQVAEEKVVAEQSPAPAATEYTYPQRLESERANDRLEKPAAGSAAVEPPSTQPAARPSSTPLPRASAPPVTRPAATPVTRPSAPPAKPEVTPAPPRATPRAPATAAAESLPRVIGSNATVKGFAVQVGAFKDHASADTVVKSLKGRGLPAYSVAPAGGGLYTVRVGVYRDRADAESVQERLRDDKFRPYIIKQ